MATITFENGKKVNFEGNPTPEDIDFVAKQIGITPSEKTGVEPTFKASIGGAETIVPNVAKTFGNIPSSAARILEMSIVDPARKIQESEKLVGDIYKDRGAIQGTKDIAGGFVDTLSSIGKAPGQFLVNQRDKNDVLKALKPKQEEAIKQRDDLVRKIQEAKAQGKDFSNLQKALKYTLEDIASMDSQIGSKEDRFNKEIEDYTSVAKFPIEKPLEVPLTIYGGKKLTTGTDIISDISRPVTNLATNVTQKSKNAIADYAVSRRPQAINDLEQTYSDLMSGTTSGKKKIAKIETKTEALNRAGTEGRTPQRTLAEEGIIPNRSGTKLDTFDQANQYREKIKPFREANREALKETELGTMPRELDDLERQAIEYARTPDNINSGRASKMEREIKAEFEILRQEYPNGKIPLSVVDDIKSARWDNVFKNKSLVEADALRKDSEYAIAKALQKDIENTARKAGNIEVAQLNREIGDRLAASKFLEELNGKTIKGGRLLKFVTTGIGASFGSGLVGKLAGALGGNIVGELIIANNVSNPIKRIILRNLERTDPKAYTKTIEWLRRQKLDRETRLLLPAPSYIPLGGKTSPVYKTEALQAQKNPVSMNPKTGRFQTTYNSQSKSPTNQQTKPAITRTSNIPLIVSRSSKKSKLLDKFKNIKNKQGGFIQAYQGEKDLTTKILKDLEGKTTVSKQYILDATNRGELKQVERDITRQVLDTMPDQVNVKEFADKVKSELLPLKRLSSLDEKYKAGMGKMDARHENITLPSEIRGKVKDYNEHLYESPIKTSAGSTHFGDASDSYFGHTRIEDMADNKTRRVIEVQSDLYQKGNLDKEMTAGMAPSSDAELAKALPENLRKEFNQIIKDRKAGIRKEGQVQRLSELNDIATELRGKSQKGKLQQYNDPTAHFRMVREEIKKASQDGKTKLQFPTGETAMKIEGLGEARSWGVMNKGTGRLTPITKDNIVVGMKVRPLNEAGDDWIITDILGDGKFRAVQKSMLEDHMDDMGVKTIKEAIDDLRSDPATMANVGEQFDISGKVDTSNPIYKFYEKDVQKYLNKFGGKQVVDDKGVSWIEVPIKKEQGRQAVEAFGKITTSPLFIGAGVSAVAVGANQAYNRLKAQREAIK